MPSSSINPTQIPPLLKHLGAITNGRSEVVFRDNCFEFYGSEVDVRRGVAAVGDVGIVKVGLSNASARTMRLIHCPRLSITRYASSWNSPTSTANLSRARRTARSTRSCSSRVVGFDSRVSLAFRHPRCRRAAGLPMAEGLSACLLHRPITRRPECLLNSLRLSSPSSMPRPTPTRRPRRLIQLP